MGLDVWPSGKSSVDHLVYISEMMHNWEREHSVQRLFFNNGENPPLYHLVAVFLIKFCFFSYKGAFLTTFVFLVILILSIYGIGAKLKNGETGIVAACLCSFFPIVWSSSIQTNLELATMAMVCLNIYVLLMTKGFSCPWRSFLFGIALGLGLLTRSFVFLFVLGPIIVTLWMGLTQQGMIPKIEKRQILVNLTVIGLTAIIIALTFYVQNFFWSGVFSKIFSPGDVEQQNILHLSHLTFYTKALPVQIGWIGVLIFLFSLYYLPKSKGYGTAILLSWILLPFIVLPFVLKKAVQYSMSYLPAIALLIALGVDEIKRKVLKNSLCLISIVIFMCNYFKNF